MARNKGNRASLSNINGVNNSNYEKKIEKIDDKIDDILYDYDSEALKIQKNNQDIYQRIQKLGHNYDSIIKTGNLLEFLTQNSLTNIKQDLRAKALNNKRVYNLNKESNSKHQINEILNNTDATQLLEAEYDRIARYSDYRLINAYIPQVSKCISFYRDSILSPDDNTKKSISVKYNIPFDDKNEEEKIRSKIETLKKEIKFDKKAKKWIDDGLVDGDVFVSVLKYDNEVNNMLLNESTKDFTSELENVILTEEEIFSEYDDIFEKVFKEDIDSIIVKEESNNKNANKNNIKKDTVDSIKKEISRMMNNNIICIKSSKDDLKYGNYVDGESDLNKNAIEMEGCLIKTLEPENTIKLSLDNEVCVGYLYFEKYDYSSEFGREGFGLNVKDLLSATMGGDSFSSISSSSTTNIGGNSYMSSTTSTRSVGTSGNNSDYYDSMSSDGANPIKDKFITELFVKGISKKLDKKIIESNQQFKEIIYHLLKKDYLIDKKVKIVYYSPEEVFHYKPIDKGIYGSSKLEDVLFYCKLFLSNLLTNTMQKVSRGRDKRVLYVETGLDDDTEDSIQEVVRDFKAKEIQSDVLRNISTILKRIGAFEDYYIPKIDGEAPVDFETISGMDVNIDDEFLNFLLKSIVSGIGVPATFVDASNELDFSRELLMQNSSLVREVVSLQSDAADFLTDVFRQAFKYRYYKELGLDKPNRRIVKRPNPNAKRKSDNFLYLNIEDIYVELPVPQFLNLANMNEQLSNYQNKIEFVVNTLYPDEMTNSMSEDPEGLKNFTNEKILFRQKYTKKMINSFDWDEIEEVQLESKAELKEKEIEEKAKKTEEELNNPQSSDGGEDLGGEGMDF